MPPKPSKKKRKVDPSQVSLGQQVLAGDYDVVVGTKTLPSFAADIVERTKATSYFVISDQNVFKLHAGTIFDGLKKAVGDAKVHSYNVVPGEEAKCRAVKAEIEDWMFTKGADRGSVIVAVGGGVVGDLAGFVAATYMRGIKFCQVPTSLLAMVDSSIGGKTGIDTPAGKNLIGAFHNPARVYIDTSVLQTLPDRELTNGMAEVIKAAAIRSKDLFKELEDNCDQILAKDEASLQSAIWQSIAIKVAVVLEDRLEKGVRAILNFGHTVGHGIEGLIAPKMLHGECVAIGMIVETELARSYGILAPDALGRLQSILLAYKLPIHIPAETTPTAIMRQMGCDKKNMGGKKFIVLLQSIGDAGDSAKPVEDIDVMKTLAPGAEVVPKGPVSGTIVVPGSKSISNRVLLLAALGRGKCEIRGLLHSHDTLVMMNALQMLGVPDFEWKDNGKVIVVTGVDGKLQHGDKSGEIFLGNAGTASRFLTTACTLVAAKETVITGNARMKERPIGPLVDALRLAGCSIDYLESEGCLPLKIAGGGLAGNEISLSANVSSQYVSSVLISAVYAKSPTTLRLTDAAVSKPYIKMTIATMADFGVKVENPSEGVYIIPNAGYDNPNEFTVEGDASSASYPLALAAITGGKITVDGIGSSSLQGDANFCRVLEKMGCTVNQTKESTTVTGPPVGTLKSVDVDMSEVTDTFMTAAVVMASTNGGTCRITNIANQRVKECDRIAAMATEFTKCGIVSRELPDGLEIDGVADAPDVLSATGADIHCYKDHRIAMSFGVLGSLWPGIHVMDKGCTDKTFPSFWNDLSLVFGLDSNPWLPAKESEGAADSVQESMVLIGMRGAGKTTFARAAAAYLTYELADVDDEIVRAVGPLDTFIAENGWPAFRTQETLATQRCLERAKKEHLVVSCGGGVVESATNRNLLLSCGIPVVWLERDIDLIEAYLTRDGTRPSLGEPIKAIYERREPLYAETSTHVFTMASVSDSLNKGLGDFCTFSAQVTGCARTVLSRIQSCVAITLPDLKKVPAETLIAICASADAVELRVDCLASFDAASVRSQVTHLRHHSTKPIVFSLRSIQWGGKFDGTAADYFRIVDVGRACSCDFVEIEDGHDGKSTSTFVAACNGSSTRVVVSAHSSARIGGVAEVVEIYHGAVRPGIDLVRMSFAAEDVADCDVLRRGIEVVRASSTQSVPLSAVLVGASGRLSMLANTFMTPTTHPALPTSDASAGLYSGLALREQCGVLGLIPKQNYFLFGTPIQKSPSPFMHNTAFSLLELPHAYRLLDTANVKDVVECLRTSTTGGGSCTIPHKQTIIPFLDELTPVAKALGAVNTVTIDADRRMIGDNTDWIGVKNALLEAVPVWTKPKAVVLGAGGTSRAVIYALKKLGCETIGVYNRTRARALELAVRFGCDVIDDLAKLTDVNVIVSTVPPKASMTVPASLLASKPVVFDVNYIPKWTALLEQAREQKCRTVHGLDMLIHQGIEQSRLWNRVEIPAAEVSHAVKCKYDAEYARFAVKRSLKQGEDILEFITKQRRLDVVESKMKMSLEQLKSTLKSSPPAPPISFVKRLQASYPTCVLSEVKRASPSKGDIALDIDAAEQTVKYAKGGAAAISILTEPTWFKGTVDDMKKASIALAKLDNRPAVLRKDFLVDPYQVYEARLFGADAVLLIVSILKDDELYNLLNITRELGMEALVEVVTPEELSRALAVRATVIGVNNRNLRDFTLDNNKTRRVLLAGGVVGPEAHRAGAAGKDGKVLLALSGISSRLDVQGYRSSGVHGVLVGEALMRAPDPTEKIFRLRGLSEEVLVKVCGLCGDQAKEMAGIAACSGVDMIGLVFAPGSKRLVSTQDALAIVEHVKQLFPVEDDFVAAELGTAPMDTGGSAAHWYTAWAAKLRRASASRPLFFGVFADQPIDEVNRIAKAAGIDIIQLSGKEGMVGFDQYCMPVVKAIHVGTHSSVSELAAHIESGRPAGLLLDTASKHKNPEPHQMGGSGVTFDWSVAAELAAKYPLYLAGGLSPGNIADGIRQVLPFGVDVSSGVETTNKGAKDAKKIKRFISEAKLAA